MASTNALMRRVLDTNSATTLAEYNAARKGLVIWNDSTAILYVLLGKSLYLEGSTTVTIDDSDNAATDGVKVYVVLDQEEQDFWYGHLEFVSPTNANASITVKNGGSAMTVYDSDDAATNGTELRCQPAGAGLESTMIGSKPCLIATATNYLYIYNVASATADSPAIYIDEDASNTYERLQAVVVDNNNETALKGILSEIPTTSQWTYKLQADDVLELFGTDCDFKGKVTGIWSADASGAAQVTELV